MNEADRPDRPDRPERPDRPDRPDRPERPEDGRPLDLGDGRPFDPRGSTVPPPPALGSPWKAVLLALVIVAGGLCVVYGIWVGLFLLMTSSLTGSYGANK